MGSIPTRSRHPGGGRNSSVVHAPSARRPLPGTGFLAAVLLSLLAWAAFSAPATAQEPAETDTAAVEEPAAVRGPSQQPDTTPSPPVSPLGAFGRSVVLPGWGQAAVDRPVRGAIYFAAEAASLWMVFKTQTKLSAAKRGVAQDSALVETRTSQREDWIVLSAFWALMSGVDAWVSAHLYGFEGQLEPPEDGTPGAQISYRIPLDLP